MKCLKYDECLKIIPEKMLKDDSYRNEDKIKSCEI